MAVLVVLLVLAIVPPNFVILRRHKHSGYEEQRASPPQALPHTHHRAA